MPMRTDVAMLVLPLLFLLPCCSQNAGENPVLPETEAVFSGGAYNQYGYNAKALRFKGIADGADMNFDGTYFGDTQYADAELTMNWNREWQRGIAEHWSNPPYNARCSYMWKIETPYWSGVLWKYDIEWVGDDPPADTKGKKHGLPIWDQFEVTFDGITAASVQFWEAQALPPGMVCPTM